MQPRLEVAMEPTDSLVPYAGNAKEHPDWQVGQIVESIERFGFDDPIAVWHDADGTPVIVEGHGRLLAARELGMEQVPTISLDHLDDEARRAYTLVHNQLTMDTGFDADLLAAELEALTDSGIEMEDFGLQIPEALTSDDMEPIDDTDTGSVMKTGCRIEWDGHTVTLASDELRRLNDAYDDYVSENGVSIGLFRSILDASD